MLVSFINYDSPKAAPLATYSNALRVHTCETDTHSSSSVQTDCASNREVTNDGYFGACVTSWRYLCSPICYPVPSSSGCIRCAKGLYRYALSSHLGLSLPSCHGEAVHSNVANCPISCTGSHQPQSLHLCGLSAARGPYARCEWLRRVSS